MGFFSLKQKLFSAAKYFSTCYELFDFKAWFILLDNPDFPDLVIKTYSDFDYFWVVILTVSKSASERHCGHISCHLPTTLFLISCSIP